MIEIRILKYFQAIVEEGSFTKAAQRLHITQPTLSRQIKAFEDYYQIALFDRSELPPKLTEDGLKLYHKSKQIIELTNKLEEDIKNTEDFEGIINIGAVESAGAEGIYSDLIKISKKNPGLSFNFYHSDSEDIKQKMDNGLLDLGILTEPVDLNHFNYLKLPEIDKWYILVSSRSKFKEYPSITWNDLINEPLILSQRFTKNGEFPEFFNSDTTNFNILATYSLFSNAIYFVESNLAVAPCIKTVHSIKNNPKVKLIPLKPEFKTGSFLVWKKDQILNRPAQKLLKLLLEEVNKHNA